METLIKLLARLPLRVLYGLARWVIYPLLYGVVRYRRRLVMQNIRYAMPNLNREEQQALARAFYRQLSDTVVELIYGYRISDEEICRRVTFEGLNEREEEILQHGGGIFMLGHMGCWEWLADVSKRFRSPSITMNMVYLALNSRGADRAMMHLRAKRGGNLIEMHRLLRTMVANRRDSSTCHVYALLADQKPSWRSLQFWTPFFGHSTPFLTGSEQLARKFGYPVYYAHIRSPRRGYYTALIETITPDASLTEEGFVTRRYAELLEQDIINQPSLWLWSHNRFKWNKDK